MIRYKNTIDSAPWLSHRGFSLALLVSTDSHTPQHRVSCGSRIPCPTAQCYLCELFTLSERDHIHPCDFGNHVVNPSMNCKLVHSSQHKGSHVPTTGASLWKSPPFWNGLKGHRVLRMIHQRSPPPSTWGRTRHWNGLRKGLWDCWEER